MTDGTFHDPFAGAGSLPLEAQRLGLEAHASDLNPVAVLINKAMIEIEHLQSEGLASRVVPSRRRGSRAGRHRPIAAMALSGVSAVTVPDCGGSP